MYDWDKAVNEYVEKKRNLQFEMPKHVSRVTHKMIKNSETSYDPVTQVYKDKALEEKLRKEAEIGKIEVAAANKDRALRYEQTYNFVNMADKLKGFENHKDYPLYKTEYKQKKLEKSYANYNILSNITLDKHNYLPPEKRPRITEEKAELKPKVSNSLNFKDYDVINNRYKEYHDEKTAIDKLYRNYSAADNYWKQNDYDFVKHKFTDPQRGVEFFRKEAEKRAALTKKTFEQLPPAVKAQSLLYNPVNNCIRSKENLVEYDRKIAEKKKRYQVRHERERLQGNKEGFPKKGRERPDVQNHNGFDLVTHEERKILKTENEGWNGFKRKIGDDKIYRAAFDWSDNVKARQVFLRKRKEDLSQSQNIGVDPLFKAKIKGRDAHSKSYRHDVNSVSVDKNEYFGGMQSFRTEDRIDFIGETVNNDQKRRENFKNKSRIGPLLVSQEL